MNDKDPIWTKKLNIIKPQNRVYKFWKNGKNGTGFLNVKSQSKEDPKINYIENTQNCRNGIYFSNLKSAITELK